MSAIGFPLSASDSRIAPAVALKRKVRPGRFSVCSVVTGAGSGFGGTVAARSRVTRVGACTGASAWAVPT